MGLTLRAGDTRWPGVFPPHKECVGYFGSRLKHNMLQADEGIFRGEGYTLVKTPVTLQLMELYKEIASLSLCLKCAQ